MQKCIFVSTEHGEAIIIIKLRYDVINKDKLCLRCNLHAAASLDQGEHKDSTDAHTGLEPLPAHPQTHTCMEMGRWVGTVQDETAAFTALPIKMVYHISCNATH